MQKEHAEKDIVQVTAHAFRASAKRTRVRDREDADAEVLSTRRTEVDVVAGVVVNGRLRQHGVVLDLRLLQRRAVVGDDDEPSLAGAKGLQLLICFVSKGGR
jgi:hypothetical protein